MAHAGRLVITATISKALGAQGGVVLGAGEVRGALVNSARPFVYTTGLAPAAAGAALESLRIIVRDGHRVRALQENSAMARSALRGAGLNILRSESAIIPAVLGDAERALRASALLRERGVLALAVRPPTVPRGTSRLRLTVSAALEVAALEAACRQVGVVCNSLLARGVPNANVEGEV
ncbi:MAG TPA: aminotransferase class I/II-fold pyridoxal phosphate-dependent enzyme, partial [Candidatus Sumerlaeota bacterium]|nr:aminotransferase class I/II-fold pyridoxal phosphate-dependent enzyme [Candidatus Sumerlaeota bacterium]